MIGIKRTGLLTAACGLVISLFPATSEAGPLLDWLRGCCRRQPVVAASPCNSCITTCMQSCQRVVVNYVPYTAYRTSWKQIPVTTYRPVTSSDPCTGCSVTCMRPCTTYTWQACQVPYTTYRPVYQTQSYQVPVTFTTQLPSTGCNSCGIPSAGCNSCGVPTAGMPVAAPAGTINTNGGFSTLPGTAPYYPDTTPQPLGAPTPADTVPSLNPTTTQMPTIIDRRIVEPQPDNNSGYYRSPVPSNTQPIYQAPGQNVNTINDPTPENRWDQNSAPPLLRTEDKTTFSPAVQRWSYSPVRTASYEVAEPVTNDSVAVTEYVGTVAVQGQSAQPQVVNDGWRPTNW